MNLSWSAFLGSEEGRRQTSAVEDMLEREFRRLRFRVLPYKSGWLLEYRHALDDDWRRVPRRMPSYLEAIRALNRLYDRWRREKLSRQKRLM